MQPKIIILNGPCGIGKSTLAERYVDDHPLSLNLDIDLLGSGIGRWREHLHEARRLRMGYAMALMPLHLASGYDVIVPNILYDEDIDELKSVSQVAGALMCELALMTDEDTAVKRFIDRGRSQGFSDGFRPGSSISNAGGEKKLREMYRKLEVTLRKRPKTTIIRPVYNDIEGTYSKLLTALSQSY